MASRELNVPDVTSLDPEQVIVRYDQPSDTMFVHFYGTGQPGVSVEVEQDIFLRLDENEQKVIGLQIEAYLHSTTLRRPQLLTLAQFTDMPDDLLQDWMQRKESRAARLGFIDAVVHEWTGSVEA